jgi:hypothetical protein
MCYSYEISRNAFIVGMLSSLFLFFSSSGKYPQYTPKMIALIYMFVALMQYYDSIFWSNPPTDKNGVKNPEKAEKNARFTKIATITNNIQPIVLGLIIYYFKGGLSDFSKKLLIVYTIATIIYTRSGWDTLKYTQVTPETTCKDGKESLYWRWNHFEGSKYYYAFYLFVLNYLFIKEVGGYIGKISAVLLSSAFVFTLWKYNKILSLGRFWCLLAAYTPIIYLLIFKII